MGMMGTLKCCTAECVKLSYSEYFNNYLVLYLTKWKGTCEDSSLLMKFKGNVWDLWSFLLRARKKEQERIKLTF